MQSTAASKTIACPGLDCTPNALSYVKLREGWGQRFMLFCDTEEEFDWTKPRRRENRSTSHMAAMPATHERLHDLGARTIYLVDHPIVCDPAAVAMLGEWAKRGECEIGTQLHPWVNPPFDEELSTPNSFAGNLPAALERAKLELLTDAIADAFGRRPTVYRAGRYGVGPNSAQTLIDLGYRLDVSVRASFEYGGEGGPDFSNIRPLPYRVGAHGELLELPLSAAYLGALGGIGRHIFPSTRHVSPMRGLLARAGMLNRVSLTPEGVPLKEALAAVERLLDDGVQVLSFSYHSPSVEPGHTPFVRDAADLAAFHGWWDAVLGLLARRGVASASADELLQAASEAA